MLYRVPGSTSPCTRTGSTLRHLLIACTVLTVTGVSFFVLWVAPALRPPQTPNAILRQARLALARGEYSEAKRTALQIPADHPRYPSAVMVAGEALTKDGRLQEAADVYQTVPLTASTDAVLIHFSRAEVLLHSSQISEAEQAYRAVVEVEPGYVEAHSRLAFILGVTGRRRESEEYLFTILRSGSATLNELILLADLGRPVNETKLLTTWHKRNPGDPFIRLGLSVRAAVDGNTDQALDILQLLCADFPLLQQAQAQYGALLAERRPHELRAWHDSLPPESVDWPDIWFVKGRWAQLSDKPEVAARCFLRVLRQIPLHRRATYELGIVLHRLEHPAADRFSALARQLLELSTWLTDARESNGTSEDAMRNILQILQQQNRIWETCAWATMARQTVGERDWISRPLARLAPHLSPRLPLHPAQTELLQLVDTSRFPPFDAANLHVPGQEAIMANDSSSTSLRTRIRFRETEGSPLPFVYFNAHDESTKGARIQEQTGGGASVLDFDRDSFPDLYFVQGSEWKHEATEATATGRYVDGVFRNVRGTELKEVTAQTGIEERRFGQCAAVGDVNEDGFADLYIANIGANQLYLNNGDGTFRREASAVKDQSPLFTSSAVVADLNGDGNSDLFDANYVTGRDVYHRICGGRACSPAAFDGVLDLAHLGDGAGGFRTVAADTPNNDAKGLGAVAFSLSDPLRPSVFVANDQTPNFLLQYSEESNSPRLTDSALSSGLAYSQEGLVTAAMGIAADDVDHNGLTDLFISNFQDESNCLYLQSSPGFFTDHARAAGLRAPSYAYVGWGAQFLDADLDGQLDLVLTNGHVGSYFDEGRPPKMPCQLFRNTGEARFKELSAEQCGVFFAETFYGRSIARLDWNRDGRADFVMVPIREKVRLLTNDSDTEGRFVNVQLTATQSARDAYFTTVELHSNQQVHTRQLVSGGGYHASNECVLQFGFPDEQPGSLVVRWPSGSVSRLSATASNVTVHVIEGHNQAAVFAVDGSSRLVSVQASKK